MRKYVQRENIYVHSICYFKTTLAAFILGRPSRFDPPVSPPHPPPCAPHPPNKPGSPRPMPPLVLSAGGACSATIRPIRCMVMSCLVAGTCQKTTIPNVVSLRRPPCGPAYRIPLLSPAAPAILGRRVVT